MQVGTFLWKHLSPETRWRLVKANASVLSDAAGKKFFGSRKKKIIAGMFVAGVVGGIFGVLLWKRAH